ncbi:MAG: transcriptional repressor [Desulfobacterales bacterium]|nr:transcriptional repressor [Desulfobacterales bacterium]MDX2510086.1 transcriptional repressor [Desulfobacterales bacterium]
MEHIHRQEKQQFKKLFKQEYIDVFEDRFNILEVFLQTEKHLTVDELINLLEEKGYNFEPDFIRDTLKLMVRFGFAKKNRFNNGPVRYEHMHLGQHHDHMICTKCRKIVEFREDRLEDLQVQIAAAHGFHMLQHKMEIYGICSECLKNRIQVMPLVMAKPGERLIIKDITGGTGARMRLLSMGLRLKDEIEIVTNPKQGQIVVAVDLKRFILGRGLAQKIMVQPAERK